MNYIYSLFGFSKDLDKYLDDGNGYTMYSLVMISVSIVIAVVYYKLIDHPRLNHNKHWFLAMLASSALNFVIGFIGTRNALESGEIPDELRFNGQEETILTTDCILFGIGLAAVSAICFILLSFGVRLISKNCRCVPYLK